MSEELKACPCCNGTAQISKGYAVASVWPHGNFYRAYCGACQLRQLFYRTEAEAIAAWNRRAAPIPPAVPEGRKLVPIVPTENMIAEFHAEEGESAQNKWAAMIASAPQEPK